LPIPRKAGAASSQRILEKTVPPPQYVPVETGFEDQRLLLKRGVSPPQTHVPQTWLVAQERWARQEIERREQPPQRITYYEAVKGLPPGSKVVSFQRTLEGGATLQYLPPTERQLAPPLKRKGFAEWLLDIGKTEPTIQVKGIITGGPSRIVYAPVKPFASVAGFVAYPETLAYAGMTWVGKEPPTRPPPSPFVVKGEYGLGYATAMVVTSYLTGEAASKIFGKVVTPKAQAWLTKQYLAKGPAEWKGLPEKFVMKVTGAKPYLAQQVVSVPTAEVVSLKGLEAEAAGWLLAETPKSSALLISKMPGETLAKAWVQEHLFKAATGGLSYALVEKELAKTLEPRMPYIPKVLPFEVSGPSLTSSIMGQLFGFGLAVGVRPKEVSKPTIKGVAKPKLFEPQMPFVGEVPALKQPTKQKVAQLAGIKQVSVLKQAVATKLIQKQIQYQPPYPPPPTMFAPQKFLGFELPKRRKRKRKKEDMFGLYGRYPRLYPVATAKQFLKMVIG